MNRLKHPEPVRVRAVLWILSGVTLLYGAACVYLYYHQQVSYAEGGALFESDLPFHVSMAVKDHWYYSLTALFYQLFYLTPWGSLLTAVFLGVVSVASVVLTGMLLDRITAKQCPASVIFIMALAGSFMMPFFIRGAHFQRYIGYQSASIWHNSTYICMKLLSIGTFSMFLKLKEKYRVGLNAGEWIGFALLLILCNSVKPSFFMIFAPAMFFFLVAELFRKVPFRRLFIFGSAVLPSLAVILGQQLILFGDDTGNGIIIKPGYALFMRGTHPKITFLLSIALPLLVLLFTLKDLKTDGTYRFAWLMWLFGFLEIFLFAETGGRAKDSNFFWSYSAAVFFVNLLAMCKLWEKYRSEEAKRAGKKWIRIFLLYAGTACMCYQTWCGVYFFCRLLTGESYWM